jgi:hypothetical protein
MLFLSTGLSEEMHWYRKAPYIPWLITIAFVLWMPYRLTRQPLEKKVANDPLAKAVVRSTKLHFEKDIKGSGVVLWAFAAILGGFLPSLILIPLTAPNTELVWLLALPMVLCVRFFIPQWLENRSIKNALAVAEKLEELLGIDIGYYVAGDRGGIGMSKDNNTLAFVRMDKKRIAKAGRVNWDNIRKWGEREGVANTIRAIGRTTTTEAVDVLAHNTGLYIEYELTQLENDRVLIPLKNYQAASWSKILSRLNEDKLDTVNDATFVPEVRV